MLHLLQSKFLFLSHSDKVVGQKQNLSILKKLKEVDMPNSNNIKKQGTEPQPRNCDKKSVI